MEKNIIILIVVFTVIFFLCLFIVSSLAVSSYESDEPEDPVDPEPEPEEPVDPEPEPEDPEPEPEEPEPEEPVDPEPEPEEPEDLPLEIYDVKLTNGTDGFFYNSSYYAWDKEDYILFQSLYGPGNFNLKINLYGNKLDTNVKVLYMTKYKDSDVFLDEGIIDDIPTYDYVKNCLMTQFKIPNTYPLYYENNLETYITVYVDDLLPTSYFEPFRVQLTSYKSINAPY